MTKFATIDAGGRATAFYDTSINGEIPDDAIEISYDQWRSLLENQDTARLDRNTGAVVYVEAPPVPPDVDALRRRAYPQIGDQLDAIWKQLNQDRLGGKALIQEADDVLNAVLAVKAKCPKP